MPALHVDQTDWVIDGSTLRKRYRYSGLLDELSVHHLQIDIDTSRSSITGQLDRHIFFLMSPSLWPQLPECLLIAQLGLLEGAADAFPVEVMVGHSDDGSLLFGPNSRDDAAALLDVVAKCRPMQLVLLEEAVPLFVLPIPNDDQFKAAARAYSDIAPDI